MAKKQPKEEIVETETPENVVAFTEAQPTESLGDTFDPVQVNEVPEKPVITPPPTSWREVTVTRNFDVKFNHEQIHGLANELVEVIREVAALEAEKKASSAEFKSKIDAALIRQTEITEKIEDGGTTQAVDCQWLFQCSGIDEKGMEIFHPEYKTLIRLDTRETVQSIKMVEADFEHQELALNVATEPEHNIEPTGPVTTGDDDDVIYDD